MTHKPDNAFTPEWNAQAPPEKSFRSIFKWGDPDSFKHPNQRLYSMLKETLELNDNDFSRRRNEGLEEVRAARPSAMNREDVEAFSQIVGRDNAGLSDFERVKYAHGQTMEESMNLRSGLTKDLPDLVLHPKSKQNVVEILALCHNRRIPVYVYGGGSSVNMGFSPVRGGVTLVMQTHMNRFLEFNEKNQTASVQAGIMGPAYEKLLNEAPARFNASRAYTCGHFPQSFEYSTVGGWIAALGSGQQSSYYGDAADLVISQEYATPAGTFVTREFPAAANGPDVGAMMKGSEGTYGVMVSAVMKVFRHMPENTRRFAYIFPSWEAAVDAAREISQGEFGMPSVFRISDPEETAVALKLYGVEGSPLEKIIQWRGLKPMQRCLFIGQADGQADFTRVVKRNVKKICRRQKGLNITGYPVKKWAHGRYTDPYLRDSLGDYGIVIDTLETTVNWNNLHQVHQAVRSFIKERPRTVCMTHSSHFYPQGTNLYFIFIAAMKSVEEYRTFQHGIIDRIEQSGGSLSHHHGVGKMIGPWMERYLSSTEMGALRALKNYFDPNGIMNPGGTLGLD